MNINKATGTPLTLGISCISVMADENRINGSPLRAASARRGRYGQNGVPTLPTIRSVSGTDAAPVDVTKQDVQIQIQVDLAEPGSQETQGSLGNQGSLGSEGNLGSQTSLGSLGTQGTQGTQGSQTKPFNFTPAYFSPPSQNALSASKTSQRRGHRYKHSSVSLNFFKEPEPRAPLAIPVSRPVPTLYECYQSVTKQQFIQLCICLAKICATVIVYSLGSPEMHSVSTLAHIIAYETVVETTVVIVGVLANFDAWTRGSMKLPFALKRIEVMMSFGLSTVLVFIGGDVISHGIEELVSGHNHGHSHSEGGSSSENSSENSGHSSLYKHFLPVFLSFLVILPNLGKQHSTIPLSLPTLALALSVLVAPLFPVQATRAIDAMLTPLIACYMIYMGWKGVKMFGSILAVSYGGPDSTELIKNKILEDKCVRDIQDFGVWQVHYDLWLVTARITISGDSKDASRVKQLSERAIMELIPVDDVEWELTLAVPSSI